MRSLEMALVFPSKKRKEEMALVFHGEEERMTKLRLEGLHPEDTFAYVPGFGKDFVDRICVCAHFFFSS